MTMSHSDWQLERFREAPDRTAIVWNDREITYGEMVQRYEAWLERLTAAGVVPGCVVTVAGDYSPSSVACMMALIRLNCVFVPLARESIAQHDNFREIAETIRHRDRPGGQRSVRRLPYRRNHTCWSNCARGMRPD